MHMQGVIKRFSFSLILVIILIIGLTGCEGIDGLNGGEFNGENDYYTLTMRISGEGLVEPEVGEYDYEAGAIVNISAEPAEGWSFKEWSGEVQNSTAKETTINMTGNISVTAVFEKDDDLNGEFYEVSGKVLDGRTETGIQGIVLSFGEEYTDEVTDSKGNWSKSGLLEEVTITPLRNGLGQFTTFSPRKYIVDNDEEDIIFFKDVELFNNNNILAVADDPPNPTEFVLTDYYLITHIRTYHWNSGSGKEPGTIALEDEDGVVYGPWQADEWNSNRYWYVEPDIELGPGQYRVIDSDNSTWSHNSESENRGFAYVGGLFVKDGNDEQEFAGGDGSEGNPFLIANADHLNNVRNYLDKNFLQIADVSLINYNQDDPWIPINNFNGSYDGGNFEINSLFVEYKEDDNISNYGLFEILKSDSEIKDLSIVGAHIYGRNENGILAGRAEESVRIDNISVSGEVHGRLNSGGIIGRNEGEIINSFADVDISNDSSNTGGLVGLALNSSIISGSEAIVEINGDSSGVGGLVGTNQGQIIDSQVTGTVTGQSNNVGGLAGESRGNIQNCSADVDVTGIGESVGGLLGRIVDITVEGSHATGDVNSEDRYVGGLIGYSIRSEVIDCYAKGVVSSSDSYVGGLIGTQGTQQINGGNVITSFAEGDVSGRQYVGGLIGYSYISDIDDVQAYGNVQVEHDFGNSHAGGLIGYYRGSSELSSITNATAEGDVDTNTGYAGGLIGTIFHAIIEGCTAYGDVNGESGYLGGLIGSVGSAEIHNSLAYGDVTNNDDGVRVGGFLGEFSGTFDRNGGIYSSYSYGDVISDGDKVGGFIGHASDLDLVDCHSEGNILAQGEEVGGFIGYSLRGDINDSSAKGNVEAYGQRVGGFIGYNSNSSAAEGIIKNSYAYGEITGNDGRVGGFIGQNYWVPIRDSGAYGDVHGEGQRVGGFIGDNSLGAITRRIENSYAINDVTGMNNYIGGFVGFSAGSGLIKSCYSEGDVTGSGDYVGGFVGRQGLHTPTTYNIRESYSEGAVYNSGSYTGGFVGELAGAIKNSYAHGSVEAEEEYLGGFAGRNGGWSDTGIVNSYAAVEVIVHDGDYTGGFLGNPSTNINVVESSYFDQEINTDPLDNILFGKTTEEMNNQSTFVDWDFVNTWRLDNSREYPYLISIEEM